VARRCQKWAPNYFSIKKTLEETNKGKSQKTRHQKTKTNPKTWPPLLLPSGKKMSKMGPKLFFN
jgi:hypothetical protein